ncbi:MAG: Aminodeoxyfutalosine deaminase [Gammaproteobacteria bacterium]|nr:Aminodeoxyfutalosine deaminase [Gammaproteobacteria bacterium]
MSQYRLFTIIFACFFWLNVTAGQNPTVEKKVNAYFSQIQQHPIELYQFLYLMPKGGDLHNHFSGATYAENLISYGQKDDLCIEQTQLTVMPTTDCHAQQKIASVRNNSQLYNNLIDAWSMYNFSPAKESASQHFFSSFGKFNLLVNRHPGEVLAEIVDRAGSQNISYLELMLTPYDLNFFNAQGEITAAIGKQVGWDPDLLRLRHKMLQQGLKEAVNQIPAKITAIENDMREHLHCNQVDPRPGCHVVVRYQYIALRGLPPEQFFAQLITAFEAASLDKRILGINIVEAEDGPIATRDYNLHMQMLNTLHQLYPKVNISLHAGELAANSVSPETLRFHIRQAIETGHAQRIGHGVAIGYEDNSEDLLAKMAKAQVMVEINLTSNESLLGVQGQAHPLPLYLKHQVPVALSTDDEGVFRTYITREYQRAVRDYQLNYSTLKMLVRNSISYSFLPGTSLWQKSNSRQQVKACARDLLGAHQPSKTCQAFLAASEKARLQWQLENKFHFFETQISHKLALNRKDNIL